jgi:hypothetical protein
MWARIPIKPQGLLQTDLSIIIFGITRNEHNQGHQERKVLGMYGEGYAAS